MVRIARVLSAIVAPLYRWNVDLKNGASDFGVMRFHPGGSAEGKIVAAGLPAPAVTVDLTPEATLSGDAARRNAFRGRRRTKGSGRKLKVPVRRLVRLDVRLDPVTV